MTSGQMAQMVKWAKGLNHIIMKRKNGPNDQITAKWLHLTSDFEHLEHLTKMLPFGTGPPPPPPGKVGKNRIELVYFVDT